MNLKNYTLALMCFYMSSQIINAQIYVKWDATGANTGESWEHAYTNLHDAINDAHSGDEIWITAGEYMPSESTNPEFNTFLINENIRIYGGLLETKSLCQKEIGRPMSQYYRAISMETIKKIHQTFSKRIMLVMSFGLIVMRQAIQKSMD